MTTADFKWNGIAEFNLGEIYSDIGEYQKSEEHYSKAIRLFEQNRSSPSTTSLAKLCLVRNKVLKSDKSLNLESIYKNKYKSNYKIYDGWKARYFSEILLNLDDKHLFESEDWIRKAIEANKRNGTMWFLANDYALYAGLLQRKGDLQNAKENLNNAIEIFKECGADGWVEKYEKDVITHS